MIAKLSNQLKLQNYYGKYINKAKQGPLLGGGGGSWAVNDINQGYHYDLGKGGHFERK